MAVPPGSRVARTGMARASSAWARRRIWVVLPLPSGPSKVKKRLTRLLCLLAMGDGCGAVRWIVACLGQIWAIRRRRAPDVAMNCNCSTCSCRECSGIGSGTLEVGGGCTGIQQLAAYSYNAVLSGRTLPPISGALVAGVRRRGQAEHDLSIAPGTGASSGTKCALGSMRRGEARAGGGFGRRGRGVSLRPNPPYNRLPIADEE